MHRIRTSLAITALCFIVGTSLGQPSAQKSLEIPPDHWDFRRLDELKLKAVRVNISPGEILVRVEFTETITSVALVDLKRKLNQNPVTVLPYTLAFMNADRKVKTVPIGRIQDEITGHVGDCFDMPFLLPSGFSAFNPTDVELRAP